MFSIAIADPSKAASSSSLPPRPIEASCRNPADNPAKDDIRIQYHEKAGKPLKVSRFEDYHLPNIPNAPPIQTTSDDVPWKPLDAALSKKQVDNLVKIIRRCVEGGDSFNLKSHKDLVSLWKDASVLVSPVCIAHVS
jgi:hypothetical protein